jgi:hypothetical protein
MTKHQCPVWDTSIIVIIGGGHDVEGLHIGQDYIIQRGCRQGSVETFIESLLFMIFA